jgi:SAM-dependent methyltransferase
MINLISSERTIIDDGNFFPTSLQHLTVYKYIANKSKGKTVLDLGCGTGYGAEIIAEKARTVHAIDIDLSTIERNIKRKKSSKIHYECADITRCSLNHTYSVILALQVIEHLTEPDELLKTVVKAMAPNSVFYLTTPNRITQSYNENPFHYKEYSAAEIKKILSSYFQNVKIYGVKGNAAVKEFERSRRKSIQKVFSFDILRIRRVVPRLIRQYLFILATYILRRKIHYSDNHKTKYKYSIDHISNGAIDILAVCTNIKHEVPQSSNYHH